MNCSVCGRENPEESKFCNNCGSILSKYKESSPDNSNGIDGIDSIDSIEESDIKSQSSEVSQRNENLTSNKWVHADSSQSTSAVENAKLNIAQNETKTYVNVPKDALVQSSNETKPNATSMIVFSVINIVCCGHFILGIIALVFSLMANNDNDYIEARNKLKIAKIINIVSVVLTAVTFIVIIILIVFGVIFSANNSVFEQTFTYGNDIF